MFITAFVHLIFWTSDFLHFDLDKLLFIRH